MKRGGVETITSIALDLVSAAYLSEHHRDQEVRRAARERARGYVKRLMARYGLKGES